MSTASQRKFTVAEYLAREEQSEIKHEFYQGEIFAMAGGSLRHARLAATLIRLLGNKLQGKPCQPLGSDMRVSVAKLDFYAYPDTSVLCGEPQFDPSDRNTITNPTIIVEVLSPSTERYDRTIKFAFFRKMASLKQYVLVSQEEARIEAFHKDSEGGWQFTDAVGLEATIQFPPIQCELALSEIYQGVELDPSALRLKPDAND
jgi:Uma2 family endonuclease